MLGAIAVADGKADEVVTAGYRPARTQLEVSMITPAYVRKMAAYNRWQNQNLYGTAGKLSDEQRKQQRGAFFGSIAGTLSHLLWADQIWMSRFAGTPRPKAAGIPDSSGHGRALGGPRARARGVRRGHRRLGGEARPAMARERSHLVLGRRQARRDEAQGAAGRAFLQPPDAPPRPGALHAHAVRGEARRYGFVVACGLRRGCFTSPCSSLSASTRSASTSALAAASSLSPIGQDAGKLRHLGDPAAVFLELGPCQVHESSIGLGQRRTSSGI